MQLERKLSTQSIIVIYLIGVTICVLTQLIVLLQHGPKVYVSLLWAPLYPVQIFVNDLCKEKFISAQFSIQDTTVRGIAVIFSSLLLGLIVPAVAGLARSKNRFVRYFGITALVVLLVSAVVWAPFPNAI